MRTARRAIGTIVAILAAGAVAALAATPAPTPRGFGASPLLHPPEELPITFSHRLHTPLATCRSCHVRVAGSVRAADADVPTEERCAHCHPTRAPGLRAEDATAARCGFCHPTFRAPGGAPRYGAGGALENPPPRVLLPPPYLRFDHAVHERAGIDCLACHAPVPGVDLATRENALPLMSDCLGCHDGRRASAECRTCHLTDGAGRVRWKLPTGRLVPSGRSTVDAHDDAFARDHGPAARRRPDLCRSCHADEACTRCHDGATRPQDVHPGNWIVFHPVPARKDPKSCTACHRTQSDCLTCHRQSRIVAEGDTHFPKERRLHPDGWTVGNGEVPGPGHHGREARRSLPTCSSCHREDTCLACHRSRSLSGGAVVAANPHGHGFRDRCRAMLERNRALCERCHAPGDAALSACR